MKIVEMNVLHLTNVTKYILIYKTVAIGRDE